MVISYSVTTPRLFCKAVRYHQGLRKEIAKKCFRAGVGTLDRIPPEEEARQLFSGTWYYDAPLKHAAAKRPYEKFKSLLQMTTAQNEDSGRSGKPRKSPLFCGTDRGSMEEPSVLTVY